MGSTTSWTTGTCRTSGVDIHYVRTGDSGPPVVLLHGLAASGACWTPLARVLERDFDVVMPDARGHGRSSAPSSGYGYDEHASDAIALIRALGLSAPVLVGHSMGGMAAAVVASRSAGLLRGVVLVDPTFLAPERQREVHDSDVAEQHRQLLRQARSDVLAELRSRHPSRTPEILELLASARLQTSASAFDVLVSPNPDYRRLVAAIDVPIVLVIGDAGVVSLEQARALQALNPRLRVESIGDAGHGLPYDQPERLATVVGSFVRAMTASSATA